MAKRRKRKGKSRERAQGGDVQVAQGEALDAELLNVDAPASAESATPESSYVEAPNPVPPAPESSDEASAASPLDVETRDDQQLDASMAAWTPEPLEGADSDADETRSSDPAAAKEARSLEERLASNDFEGSLPLLEAALLERPTDIDLLLLAGRTYTELGDHGRAQIQFRAALELRPEDLQIQRELGLSLFRRGVYAEAAEALSVVCARSESDSEAYYYRGEAQNRSGQTEAAAETMEKAARLAPTDGRIFRSLGRIYDRLGMPDQAAENYSKARKAPPSTSGA